MLPMKLRHQRIAEIVKISEPKAYAFVPQIVIVSIASIAGAMWTKGIAVMIKIVWGGLCRDFSTHELTITPHERIHKGVCATSAIGFYKNYYNFAIRIQIVPNIADTNTNQ